jgi:hypothetical protein
MIGGELANGSGTSRLHSCIRGSSADRTMMQPFAHRRGPSAHGLDLWGSSGRRAHSLRRRGSHARLGSPPPRIVIGARPRMSRRRAQCPVIASCRPGAQSAGGKRQAVWIMPCPHPGIACPLFAARGRPGQSFLPPARPALVRRAGQTAITRHPRRSRKRRENASWAVCSLDAKTPNPAPAIGPSDGRRNWVAVPAVAGARSRSP